MQGLCCSGRDLRPFDCISQQPFVPITLGAIGALLPHGLRVAFFPPLQFFKGNDPRSFVTHSHYTIAFFICQVAAERRPLGIQRSILPDFAGACNWELPRWRIDRFAVFYCDNITIII